MSLRRTAPKATHAVTKTASPRMRGRSTTPSRPSHAYGQHSIAMYRDEQDIGGLFSTLRKGVSNASKMAKKAYASATKFSDDDHERILNRKDVKDKMNRKQQKEAMASLEAGIQKWEEKKKAAEDPEAAATRASAAAKKKADDAIAALQVKFDTAKAKHNPAQEAGAAGEKARAAAGQFIADCEAKIARKKDLLLRYQNVFN